MKNLIYNTLTLCFIIIIFLIIYGCSDDEKSSPPQSYSSQTSQLEIYDSEGNLVIINNSNSKLFLYNDQELIKKIPINSTNFLINIPTEQGKIVYLKIYKEIDIVQNNNIPNSKIIFRSWDVVLSNSIDSEYRMTWIINSDQQEIGSGTIAASYENGTKYSVDIFLNGRSGSKIFSMSPGQVMKKSNIDFGNYKIYYRYWESDPNNNYTTKEIGWIEHEMVLNNQEPIWIVLNSLRNNHHLQIPHWNGGDTIENKYGKVNIYNRTTFPVQIWIGNQLIEQVMYTDEPTDNYSTIPVDDAIPYIIPIGNYLLTGKNLINEPIAEENIIVEAGNDYNWSIKLYSTQDDEGNIVIINQLNESLLLYDSTTLLKEIPPNLEFLVNINNETGLSKILNIWKKSDVNNLDSPPFDLIYRKWEVILSSTTYEDERTTWIIKDGDRGKGVGTLIFNYPFKGEDNLQNIYSVDVYIDNETIKRTSLSPSTSGKQVGDEYGYHQLFFHYWFSDPDSAEGRQNLGWIKETEYGKLYEVVINSAKPNAEIDVPVYYESSVGRYGYLTVVNNSDYFVNIYANDLLIEAIVKLDEPTGGLSTLEAHGYSYTFLIPQDSYTFEARVVDNDSFIDSIESINVIEKYNYLWVVSTQNEYKAITINNETNEVLTIHDNFSGSYIGHIIQSFESKKIKILKDTISELKAVSWFINDWSILVSPDLFKNWEITSLSKLTIYEDSHPVLFKLPNIIKYNDNLKFEKINNLSLGNFFLNNELSGFSTFTPYPNKNGVDIVSYSVLDSNLIPIINNDFYIEIKGLNDPPVSSDLNFTTLEDSRIHFDLVFQDIESDELTLFILSECNSGDIEIVDSEQGNLTYTPHLNFNGIDSFTYCVFDGELYSKSSIVTFNVESINDPPLLSIISDVSIIEDSVNKLITCTVNDVDSDINLISYKVHSSNNDLVPNRNIILSKKEGINELILDITPLQNANGFTRIDLIASDQNGLTAINSISFNVTSVNDAPIISACLDYTIVEDTETTSLTITVNDIDSELNLLTVNALSSNISLVSNEDISIIKKNNNTRQIIISPKKNQFGYTLITFTVSDYEGLTASTSFILNITEINDPPTITNFENYDCFEDDIIPLFPIESNDLETEYSDLKFFYFSSNTELIHNQNLKIVDQNEVKYLDISLNDNMFGLSTITIVVEDEQGLTGVTKFNINVKPVNDPPIISSIEDQEINEDSQLKLTFFTSDIDSISNPVNITIFSSNNRIVQDKDITIISEDNQVELSITPIKNSFGNVVITVIAADSEGYTSEENFNLLVQPINDKPYISNIDTIEIDEDTISEPISFTIIDNETIAYSLSIELYSSYTKLVSVDNIKLERVGSACSLLIYPSLNQSGTTEILVKISDPEGLTSLTQFTAIVNPVNDTPYLSKFEDQVIIENSKSNPIFFTTTDIETQSLSLTIQFESTNKDLISNEGIIFYQQDSFYIVQLFPQPNITGQTTITVTVIDPEGLTACNEFEVAVNKNTPPTLSTFEKILLHEDFNEQKVNFLVSDAETPAYSLTINFFSSNTQVIPDENITIEGSDINRSLSIVSKKNSFGKTIIYIVASDTQGLTTTSLIDVVVESVNDPPFISFVSDQAIDENSSNLLLSFTVTDTETSPYSLTFDCFSSNDNVIPEDNILIIGNGENKSLSITFIDTSFDSISITLVVSDSESLSSSIQFKIKSLNSASFMINDCNIIISFNYFDFKHEGVKERYNSYLSNEFLIFLNFRNFNIYYNDKCREVV